MKKKKSGTKSCNDEKKPMRSLRQGGKWFRLIVQISKRWLPDLPVLTVG